MPIAPGFDAARVAVTHAQLGLAIALALSTTSPRVAAAIAKKLGKAFSADAVRKTKETPGLKNVHDPEQRRELLDGAFQASLYSRSAVSNGRGRHVAAGRRRP